MMAASEEYEEDDSLDDQDEVPEPVTISDDSCLIAADMSGDDIVLQGGKGEILLGMMAAEGGMSEV
jgi:hypothetical protein